MHLKELKEKKPKKFIVYRLISNRKTVPNQKRDISTPSHKKLTLEPDVRSSNTFRKG